MTFTVISTSREEVVQSGALVPLDVAVVSECWRNIGEAYASAALADMFDKSSDIWIYDLAFMARVQVPPVDISDEWSFKIHPNLGNREVTAMASITHDGADGCAVMTFYLPQDR